VANIKSQIKRNKTNQKATDRNRAVRSEVRTSVRQAREAIKAGDKARPWPLLPTPAASWIKPSARVSCTRTRLRTASPLFPSRLRLSKTHHTSGRPPGCPLVLFLPGQNHRRKPRECRGPKRRT